MGKKLEYDFKGVWIPKELYQEKTLSWTKKLLLIEAWQLDGGDGCYAGDNHFAEHLMIAPKTVRNLMYDLVENGWITIENPGTRNRRIYVQCPELRTVVSRKKDSSVPKKGQSSNKETKKEYKEAVIFSRKEMDSIHHHCSELQDIPIEKYFSILSGEKDYYAMLDRIHKSVQKQFKLSVDDYKRYLTIYKTGRDNGAFWKGNSEMITPATITAGIIEHLIKYATGHNLEVIREGRKQTIGSREESC